MTRLTISREKLASLQSQGWKIEAERREDDGRTYRYIRLEAESSIFADVARSLSWGTTFIPFAALSVVSVAGAATGVACGTTILQCTGEGSTRNRERVIQHDPDTADCVLTTVKCRCLDDPVASLRGLNTDYFNLTAPFQTVKYEKEVRIEVPA